MNRPTEEQCRTMLDEGALRQGNGWIISSYPYSDEQALKIAEYCLLTGQKLTAVGTIEGLLDLARRIATLERKVLGL